MFTSKESVSSYAAVAFYAIAWLLFLFPLFDALVAIVPMLPGEITWRYRALLRFSNAMLPALLGVLLAYTFALFQERSRAVRAISIASGVWAVALIGVTLLFIMTAADVRAGSLARDKTAFDVATTISVLKYVAAILVSVAFTAPAWLAARRIRHEAHLSTPDEVAPPQLVMRPHRRETVTV